MEAVSFLKDLIKQIEPCTIKGLIHEELFKAQSICVESKIDGYLSYRLYTVFYYRSGSIVSRIVPYSYYRIIESDENEEVVVEDVSVGDFLDESIAVVEEIYESPINSGSCFILHIRRDILDKLIQKIKDDILNEIANTKTSSVLFNLFYKKGGGR